MNKISLNDAAIRQRSESADKPDDQDMTSHDDSPSKHKNSASPKSQINRATKTNKKIIMTTERTQPNTINQ